jgi:long-chain fatty acid transport protein
MKKLITSLALAFVVAGTAYGSGYQVFLQSNRATGMGNLSVAIRPDASSIFFNPGATAFMDQNGVMIGANFIFTNNVYWNSTDENSNYTAESDNPLGTPFHGYFVWGPAESRFKFGISATTPFGSGVNWGNEWAGRDLLHEISLRAIQVQPTASFRLTDNLAIGAGLVIGFGSVSLERSIFQDPTGNAFVNLDGDAETSFGYNLGIMFSPSDKVDIGLSYRSKVIMELQSGEAVFTDVPATVQAAGGIPDRDVFDAELPLPSVFNIGLTFHPTERLSIGTEFNYVGWSAYDSLVFDFEQAPDSRSPRQYEDSWILHLGGEYKVNDLLQIRAGGYYDTTPVQEGYMTPETPDANRLGLTLGIGLTLNEHFQIDASFLYIDGMEREQTVADTQEAGTYNPRGVMPGTYELNAFVPGISVSYTF